MRITFHGTRGSVPAPGPRTARYGGNTSCLELVVEDHPPVFIDAGTGLRAPGKRLAAGAPGEAVLIMTHLHWDHIMGFPFFRPIHTPGWSLRLGGWPKGLTGLKALFGTQQGLGRFPVRFEDLPADIRSDESLCGPSFRLGGVGVRTCPLNHPQGAVGLRLGAPGGDVVLMADHELDPDARWGTERTVEFCRGARIIVHDAQYLPSEMPRRRGWGHSDWQSALDMARRAGAETLVLTHHDPDRTDERIDGLLAEARAAAGTSLRVEAAWEGLTLQV